MEKVSCSHQGSLVATPTQQDPVFPFLTATLTTTLSCQQLAGVEDDAERLCLVADCGGERDELTLSVRLLGLGEGVWSLMHQHSHLQEREGEVLELYWRDAKCICKMSFRLFANFSSYLLDLFTRFIAIPYQHCIKEERNKGSNNLNHVVKKGETNREKE